jgi:hypothetical protein
MSRSDTPLGGIYVESTRIHRDTAPAPCLHLQDGPLVPGVIRFSRKLQRIVGSLWGFPFDWPK